MKKLIFLAILILPLFLSAQANFEGIITYKGYATPDDQTIHLTIYYGKTKMKVEVRSYSSLSKLNEDKKNIVNTIYHLKKGIGYNIDSVKQLIEIDSLNLTSSADQEVEFIPTDSLKAIGTHTCRLFIGRSTSKDSVAIMSKGSVSLWFAENIKYIIPNLYRNKRSLQTTNDGNCIWLELIMIFEIPPPFDSQKQSKDTIFMQAILVEKKPLPDSIFDLPSNFRFTYKDYGLSEDLIETESVIDELKKVDSKKSSSSPSKASTKKEKATKPVKG
jgi:hypothetical protein